MGVFAQKNVTNQCLTSYDSVLKVHQLHGGFLIYDEQNSTLYSNQFHMLDSMLSPASTFKIYNALQALDNKLLFNENDTLHWDGKMRRVEAWNRDLSLQEAFSASAVWYFQEVARRSGKERMQHTVKADPYTHLTLPTILTVVYMVVVVAFQHKLTNVSKIILTTCQTIVIIN